MLSSQEEQEERRRVALQDADVRRQQQQAQGGTFHAHAQAQANELSGGRFAATGSPRVVGSTPNPSAQYPAASVAHQTELPPEEPLGIDINAMLGLENPTGDSSSGVAPVATGAPAGAAASALK